MLIDSIKLVEELVGHKSHGVVLAAIDLYLPIEEDLKRRDFTMNSLYYNPIKDEWFDFHNGRKDIDKWNNVIW